MTVCLFCSPKGSRPRPFGHATIPPWSDLYLERWVSAWCHTSSSALPSHTSGHCSPHWFRGLRILSRQSTQSLYKMCGSQTPAKLLFSELLCYLAHSTLSDIEGLSPLFIPLTCQNLPEPGTKVYSWNTPAFLCGTNMYQSLHTLVFGCIWVADHIKWSLGTRLIQVHRHRIYSVIIGFSNC